MSYQDHDGNLRIGLVMKAPMVKVLEELRKHLGCSDVVDVLRIAIVLSSWIADKEREGFRMCLMEPDTPSSAGFFRKKELPRLFLIGPLNEWWGGTSEFSKEVEKFLDSLGESDLDL